MIIEVECMEHENTTSPRYINSDCVVLVEPFEYLSDEKTWEGSRIHLDNGRVVDTPTGMDEVGAQLKGIPVE